VSNRHECTLGDLIDDGRAELQTGPFGTMLHASAYEDSGTPVIAVKHIGDNALIHADLPRIGKDDVERLQRYKLRQGDIIFARKGSVSRRAIVRADEDGWVQGSDCIRLRLDTDKINPAFVAYCFGTQAHITWIEQHAHGATMPSLNQEILRLIPIMLPSKELQDHIAHILGTLDDKIELNRRMNRTLEAIARAIFKSWFVDFDPVHAKAEGREPIGMDPETAALFPDSFQDSPLGESPKGWVVGSLHEHINFALGGDWGKETEDEVHTEPAYCIRGTDLPALQQGQLPELRLRYLKPSSREKRSLQPFDVVFEVSGGSPTQSTGRSLLLNRRLLGAYDLPLVCTNFCRLVRFSSEEVALFASFLLRRLYSVGVFFAHETGTTTIKNFAFKRFFENFDVAIPDQSVLSAFSQALAPLLEARALSGTESDVLSTQRDVLPPHLLAGEIDGSREGSG